MAVVANEYLDMLKEYWIKNGVQNLFGVNSKVPAKFDVVRVVGKVQKIALGSGFGGAISGSYTKALDNIASQGEVTAFAYEPGRIFSLYSVGAPEIAASKNYDGATMKIEGYKHFCSTERARKALSIALYGRGYGELCVIGSTSALATNADTTYTIPFNARMAITVGTKLALKATVSGAEAATMTVKSIGQYDGSNSVTITVRGDAAYTPAATDILCFAGAVANDANNSPRFPVGLGGLFPVVGQRTGADWTTYIGTSFFGINRSKDVNGLAGQYVKAASGDSKMDTLKKALRMANGAGSKADLIVLNDIDWESLSKEVETASLYYTNTRESGKRDAHLGYNSISVNFYNQIVERVIPDAFCPKGTFYVLDTDTIKFLSYFNASELNDGLGRDEPGKVMNAEEGAGSERATDPFSILIDDWLSSEPGHDENGVISIISMNILGTYATLNPSVNVVGRFVSAAADENTVEEQA